VRPIVGPRHSEVSVNVRAIEERRN
jgi:hypothetical protein